MLNEHTTLLYKLLLQTICTHLETAKDIQYDHIFDLLEEMHASIDLEELKNTDPGEVKSAVIDSAFVSITEAVIYLRANPQSDVSLAELRAARKEIDDIEFSE